MKNKKKKTSKKIPEARVSLPKKISYIGIGALLAVGAAGLFFNHQLSEISLLSDTPSTITLPTPAPISFPPPITEAQTATPAPPENTQPPVEEHPVQPVFNIPDPLVLSMPADGVIQNPFSMDQLLYSKTMNDWRTHNGIDIQADSVSEVRAAADGVVEKAYQDPLMGFTIILMHQEDYQTIYQNLASTQMVKEGQNVSQGQVIAAVGNSAPAELLEESHLHFALKQGDIFLNPMEYLVEN